MLAFLLQVNAWITDGQLRLFAVFMALVWLLWLIRVVLAHHYWPTQYQWQATTSVIIPVVDEPERSFPRGARADRRAAAAPRSSW